MRNVDKQYISVCRHLLNSDLTYPDHSRTVEGKPLLMKGMMGATIELTQNDLNSDFPLLNCKKVNFNAVLEELRWFLSGSTNVLDISTKIWDKDAFNYYKKKLSPNTDQKSFNQKVDEIRRGESEKKDYPFIGDCGRIYGKQWRESYGFSSIPTDQIERLSRLLSENPFRRDLIVNSWNTSEIEREMMALAPCHVMFQINCMKAHGKVYAGLEMYQRSADWYLGVPFNIASYALLLKIICHIYGFTPLHLRITFGNAHLYRNHQEAVKNMLDAWKEKPSGWPCKLEIGIPHKTLLDFADSCVPERRKESKFVISHYNPIFAEKANMIAKD